MGCGGSRADAIEPRYYESWTRETESTWLTYTDSDASPSNATPDSGPEAGGLHAGTSLVAQWLRIRLPMQWTRVQSLVQEDPTCRGATKPVRHNY
ncbi:brain and acute leukemia cytoplasmic protein isoform X2 [Balaenoptera ricei]|uniref:brain and acute leukemia cytoplasmic protein isoform X2 n=1 Tax=Balaenoptera ricei TaxID=2746895 RepID=UPI0028BE1D06|nr:brain and acute leukemia cytoplasmic protein isoform X2 [Balaenoptera ricei]